MVLFDGLAIQLIGEDWLEQLVNFEILSVSAGLLWVSGQD